MDSLDTRLAQFLNRPRNECAPDPESTPGVLHSDVVHAGKCTVVTAQKRTDEAIIVLCHAANQRIALEQLHRQGWVLPRSFNGPTASRP